jgi:hypothetical protein
MRSSIYHEKNAKKTLNIARVLYAQGKVVEDL